MELPDDTYISYTDIKLDKRIYQENPKPISELLLGDEVPTKASVGTAEAEAEAEEYGGRQMSDTMSVSSASTTTHCCHSIDSSWLLLLISIVICIVVLILTPPNLIQLIIVNVLLTMVAPKIGTHIAKGMFVCNLLTHRYNHNKRHNFFAMTIVSCLSFMILLQSFFNVGPMLSFWIDIGLTALVIYLIFYRDKVCFKVDTEEICLRSIN